MSELLSLPRMARRLGVTLRECRQRSLSQGRQASPVQSSSRGRSAGCESRKDARQATIAWPTGFPRPRRKVRFGHAAGSIREDEPVPLRNLALWRECANRYGVTDLCVLTGLVPQACGPMHLAACDVLASPHVPNSDGTPFFGSPTKLFEYMAMGKGIVASHLDQIGEVLAHEQTAWMVEPGDVQSLWRGLKRLIDDAPLRSRLGAEARREVLAKYTWREHTRRIIEALKQRTAARTQQETVVCPKLPIRSSPES